MIYECALEYFRISGNDYRQCVCDRTLKPAVCIWSSEPPVCALGNFSAFYLVVSLQNLNTFYIHLPNVLTDHLNILAYIKACCLPKNKIKLLPLYYTIT